MVFKIIFINRGLIGIHIKSIFMLDIEIDHNVQHSFEMPLTWVSIVGTQKLCFSGNGNAPDLHHPPHNSNQILII